MNIIKDKFLVEYNWKGFEKTDWSYWLLTHIRQEQGKIPTLSTSYGFFWLIVRAKEQPWWGEFNGLPGVSINFVQINLVDPPVFVDKLYTFLSRR